MTISGPYLTLAGGLAIAGALLAVSNNAVHRDDLRLSSPPAAATNVDAQSSPAASTSAKPKASAKPVLTPAGTYAGKVSKGPAYIAVAVKGKTAIAYLCDGKMDEAWMQGAANKASLKLTGKAGATLTAKYSKGYLTGTVKTKKEWTFRVKAVKAPSGLYRSTATVRNAKVVGGWIISNGKQVGMVSRSTGVESPAPPIDLSSGTAIIDGATIRAFVVDGSPAN